MADNHHPEESSWPISSKLADTGSITSGFSDLAIYLNLENSDIKDDYLHPVQQVGTLHYTSLSDFTTMRTQSHYEPLKGKGVLDFKGQSMNQLPDYIVNGDVKSFKVLYLENNEFTEFPKDVVKMSSLVYLNLASQIAPKRASVSHWPALEHIPKDIGQMKQLTHLILCNNALQSLPPAMSRLHHLFHLDLSLNWLSEFPACIPDMSCLQQLYLSGNYIQVIPPGIRKLQQLTSLRMGNNKLVKIPEEICELKNLSYLSVRKNNIEALPKLLCQLTGLLPAGSGGNRLLLEDNPLEYPPRDVAAKGTDAVFSYLKQNEPTFHAPLLPKTLPAHGQGVWKSDSALPSSQRNAVQDDRPTLDARKSDSFLQNSKRNVVQDVRPKTTIQTESRSQLPIKDQHIIIEDVSIRPGSISVDLSRKKLTSLPRDIIRLTNLETLILNGNCLVDQKWITTASKCEKLERLSLMSQEELDTHHNRGPYRVLQVIPDSIYLFNNLTHLNMSNNKIRVIPVAVTYLHKLKLLDLVNNYISRIPVEIGNLEELEYLGLSSNNIKEIPTEIQKLHYLKILRLSSNRMKELPEEVCELSNLILLSVSRNDLFYLPPRLNQLQGLLSGERYHCDLLEKPSVKAGLWITENKHLMFPPLDVCVDPAADSATNVFSFLQGMSQRPEKVTQDLVKKAREYMVKSQKQDAVEFLDADEPFIHLTDEFIRRLSTKIGNEWKQVGTCLDVDMPAMDRCFTNNPGNALEATRAMLTQWRNAGRSGNTEEELLNKLLMALGKADRTDLQHKLSNMYKRLSQNPQQD